MGGEATAVYLAGGYTGKAFTELLTKESVASVVIEIAESTRENLIVFTNCFSSAISFWNAGAAYSGA